MMLHPIATVPECVTVLLYRATDLHPVVGSKLDDEHFILEEGGPEDGEHRSYPFLVYKPTHWTHLPEIYIT